MRKSAPWKVVIQPGQSVQIIGAAGVDAIVPTINGPADITMSAEGTSTQEEAPRKRKGKGGRPKGSKNKPKEVVPEPEPKVKKVKKAKKAKKSEEPSAPEIE